ncbi:MAG: hypothetical protein JW893_08125 [Candidatus Omnitrophica bacterium]|nr:hypothetical protein [Candidatus Omnitrophota bacterium]
MAKSYFVIHSVPNGIGDFWERFYILYEVGQSLGLTYLHTPFDQSNHLKGWDWAHFLGLDLGEERWDEVVDDQLPVIDISIQEIVREIFQGNSLNLVRKTSLCCQERPCIFRFAVNHYVSIREMKRAFGVLKPKLKFRERYWTRREAEPVLTAFQDPGKIKVAVHIRRGDRIHLKHWGRWYCVCGRLTERWAKPDRHGWKKIQDMRNGAKEYARFLEQLFRQTSPDRFEIRVYSDGYETADLKRRLSMTPPEFQKIFGGLLEKKKNEFDCLRRFSNVTMRVGDSLDLTLEAFHAFATADIVLRGTGNFTNPPVFYNGRCLAFNIFDRHLWKKVPDLTELKPDQRCFTGVFETDLTTSRVS